MPSSYLPLRWESTGDQWWYASPIDWAAANGHYDLVRELLRLDSNLLMKLTSLRRIRRFETVWDDESQFNNVAKSRCQVAKKLFLESETTGGESSSSSSFIQTGYGGWLLYTAASAGDESFIKELLNRDPLLVFGEGEYGVTDIFYAAARSKNTEAFRVLFDFSTSSSGELDWHSRDEFKWEMTNRAVHAAARGGNLEILKELLQDCSDISRYRDVQGSTILHSASARGQTEVVKDLVASFDIVNSVDAHGNTALHVASFHGHVSVVEALILSTPSSVHLKNHSGDTFFHMAVAGVQCPGFQKLDHHIELIKYLVCADMEDIVNSRNNEGRTALHVALTGNVNVNSDLVEILMSAPCIDLNIHDVNGMTPLDVLGQQPQSLASEILIKQLILGGGVPNCLDNKATTTTVSHLKLQSCPGTIFQVPDIRIYSYTGSSARVSSRSSDSNSSSSNSNSKKARRRLKTLFRWSRHMSTTSEGILKVGEDSEVKETDISSPSTKKKCSLSLSQSPLTSFSRSSMSSSAVLVEKQVEKQKAMHEIKEPSCSSTSSVDATIEMKTRKSASSSKRLMDQFLCFGTQDIVASVA